MTCNCGEWFNAHQDAKNLTKPRFEAAGKTKAAGGKTVQQVVATIVKTAQQRKSK